MNIDLTKIVTKAIAGLDPDKLQQAITYQIQDAIEKEVTQQLRWDSEFRKELNAKIKAEMKIDLSSISFAEYNQQLAKLINTEYAEQAKVGVIKHFQATIDRLIKQDIPAKISLQQLIDKVKNKLFAYEDGQFELIVDGLEGSEYIDGNYHLRFKGNNPNSDSDVIEISLSHEESENRNEVQITSFRVNDVQCHLNLNNTSQISVSRYYGLAKDLLQMLVQGTIIDMSERYNLDLEWNSEED